LNAVSNAPAPLLDLKLEPRQPLREVVYHALRQAIVDGRIPPAERLIETKLAHDLGISRTPIREALHKLEVEGLVRSLRPRGVVVTRVSRREIEELFEIRRLIEPQAMVLAADSLTAEDFEALEAACHDSMEHAFSANPDLERLGQTNLLFYNLLSDRCSNQQLSKLVHDLRDRFIQLDWKVSASLLTLEERRATTRLMPRILKAARDRDRAAVEQLVIERLRLLEASVLQHVP
jgi:DNA-binding GntR family transcriptional regulator